MANKKGKVSSKSAPDVTKQRTQDGGKPTAETSKENDQVRDKSVSVELQEDTCKYCLEIFKESEDAMVICERCEHFVCTSCADLSQEEYSFMQRTKILHWFCQNCEKPALNAVRADNIIEEKCSAMFADFRKELESVFMREISGLRSELADVRQRVETQESSDKKLEGERKVEERNDKLDESQKVLSEVLERERRKNNLVWFGVPESDAKEVEERVAADSTFIEDLCGRALAAKVDIISCKRLRSKGGKDVARPLLVTVKESAQVSGILKEARKLRNNDKYKGVFVKKDSTPLERVEMKKLLEERDGKREDTKKKGGDEIWIVRGGKVVNATRRHQKEVESDQRAPTDGQEMAVAE